MKRSEEHGNYSMRDMFYSQAVEAEHIEQAESTEKILTHLPKPKCQVIPTHHQRKDMALRILLGRVALRMECGPEQEITGQVSQVADSLIT